MAECRECGSRQVRAYHPIPTISLRSIAGQVHDIDPVGVVSMRRFGQITVLELSSGEEVETYAHEALIAAKIQRALVGGAA